MEKKNVVEYTIATGKANLISFALIIPILIVFLLPFVLIWDFESFAKSKDILTDYFLLFVAGGIIAHELLHGLTWAFFAPNGLKSIKFGIQWQYLTPYCHCTDPLKVKHYVTGGIMPLIVMGIIPSLIGIIIGCGVFLGFGIFFTCAAGGDIVVLFMLRKLSRNEIILDHPDKVGFLKELDHE